MPTEIRIAPDQTVSACWTGERGHGSLFQCMAGGNCRYVNALDFDELLEVVVCARVTPFPVGSGLTATREQTVALVRKEGVVLEAFPADAPIRKYSLGQLRKAIVCECGDSCGGPTDGWLAWLAEQKAQPAHPASVA